MEHPCRALESAGDAKWIFEIFSLQDNIWISWWKNIDGREVLQENPGEIYIPRMPDRIVV